MADDTLPSPDAATLRVWQRQADTWLAAAYKGDREGLAPSLGTGFWAQWRSSTGKETPAHLLLNHGHDPSILPLLVNEGLDLRATQPRPLVHGLLARTEAAALDWMKVLEPYGMDWDAPHKERTVLQGALTLQRRNMVRELLRLGATFRTDPSPLTLLFERPAPSSNQSHRWLPLLDDLRTLGYTPSPEEAPSFYAAAIPRELPLARLAWCEDWGLPLVPSPTLLSAAGRFNSGPALPPLGEWVTELTARGLNMDDKDAHGRSAQGDMDMMRRSSFMQTATEERLQKVSKAIEEGLRQRAQRLASRLDAVWDDTPALARPRPRM